MNFKELLDETKNINFLLWISEEDARNAKSIIDKAGSKGIYVISTIKKPNMKVFEFNTDKSFIEHIQTILSQKDINSWIKEL